MANEIRLRRNNIAGTITDNPLTNVATTINSPGFVDLPTVDATNHLILVLDPLETNGPAEIVRVTTHTAAASVVTVTRGAEGSAARSHANGTTWFHGPVASDWRDLATSGARPTVPYTGMEILETDTLRNMQYTGAAWQQNGLYWDPPSCRITHSVAQSINNNVQTVVAFDTETFDTDNMHNNAVNNSRITINTAGIYVITAGGEFAVAADYQMHGGYVRLNGTTPIFLGDGGAQTTANPGAWFNAAGVYKFIAGDYIEFIVQQVNGAAAARNLTNTAYSPIMAACWIGRGN